MTLPTIGILAGMGPRSTGPFIDLVVTACQELYGARDDIDFPKMLICSQPAPFYEDRPIDLAAMESATLEGLKQLEAAGAGFLAMACNTVHIYHSRLARSVRVPLLNIVDLAVEGVCRPGSTVALIAARPTADSGIFQEALAAAGHRCVDLGWQADVDHLLAATRETTDAEVFQRAWKPIAARAAEARVDYVLLACLDLSGVVSHATFGPALIDAARCLARAVVGRWLAARADCEAMRPRS